MTNFEVRVLLVLWAADEGSIGKSALNKRFNCKAAETNAVREGFMTSGAIEASADGKLFTLTDAGKTLLIEALAGDEFHFGAQIGAQMANDLLKWCRSQSVSSPVVKAAVSAIESYEAFKVVALEVYDALNRDFNMDNLVPIYRIRREIGDRVLRSEFDEWLLEMQANDMLQLIWWRNA
jgi:predicted transcriptional regulator